MYPLRRRIAAACSGILIVGSLFAIAAGSPDPGRDRDSAAGLSRIEQRKVNAVFSALGARARAADRTELRQGAAAAAALLDVSVSERGPNTVLALDTTGTSVWKTVTTKGGRVIAVDLYDTVNLWPGKSPRMDAASPIRRVRASLFSVRPQLISRVAVDLNDLCTVEVRRVEDVVEIEFAPRGSAVETAKASEAEASPEPPEIAETSTTTGASVSVALVPEPVGPFAAMGGSSASSEAAPANTAEANGESLGSMKNLFASGTQSKQKANSRDSRRVVAAVPVLVEDAETVAEPKPLVPEGEYGTKGTMAGAARETAASPSLPRIVTKVTVESPIEVAAADTASAPASAETGTAAEPAPQPEGAAAQREAIPNGQPPAAPGGTEPEPAPASDTAAAAAGVSAVQPKDKAEAAKVPAAPTQEKAEAEPAAPAKSKPPAKPKQSVIEPAASEGKALPKLPEYKGDPLYQPVNIDFREMDLSNVVALLAAKAEINVVAGTEVSGTVTASLKNVPLRDALETLLRLNGLGIVEEAGIFRIVPYEQAVAARRITRMVFLKSGQAEKLKSTLDGLLAGMPEGTQTSVSSDSMTNAIILMGPEKQVAELEKMIKQLDVTEQTLPTATESIELSYAEPKEVKTLVQSMLTKDVGKVEADSRSRRLVVTDYPVVIEQVREVVQGLDKAVKQVSIDAMIVEAILGDTAQTGVDWLVDAIHERDTAGNVVGTLRSHASVATGLPKESVDEGTFRTTDFIRQVSSPNAQMALGVLTSKIDIRAVIAAAVNSSQAQILANPVVTTVENKPAKIDIIQEIPYQEITQTTQGPPVSTTAFKQVGTSLEVTPRVTTDEDILVELTTTQSSQSGQVINGIPVINTRKANMTLLSENQQTIFIGGLRRMDDTMNVRKVPVLGDIPVLGGLFKITNSDKQHTELMVFLTCNVLGERLPELTGKQQANFDKMGQMPAKPDAQREVFRNIVHPGEMRDPIWKWRRSE